MRIALVYNRIGETLAGGLNGMLIERGHSPILFEMNPETEDSDIIYEAGRELEQNHIDRIIIICGSGLGASITANKMKGLYAAPCYEALEAHISREDYDTNVLCLSDSWLDAQTMQAIVREWLETSCAHKDRFDRALRKIKSIEDGGTP